MIEKEIEDQYLSEDKDLLDELDAIGSAENWLGVAAEKIQKLAVLQIKATLRNRKSIHDMDSTTTKFSIVLAAFAFVQIILGIYGFLFTAETSAHPYVGAFYVLCIGILIYIIYREVSRDLENRKENKK